MLSAFASAFRTPDLRKKLLFTLGIIALFRLGLPGVILRYAGGREVTLRELQSSSRASSIARRGVSSSVSGR